MRTATLPPAARPGAIALGLLFFFGATPPAAAQSPLRFGLQSGLHLSTYQGGEAGSRARWVPGFTAGALAHWHWAARHGLQVEARYTQKGTSRPDCRYPDTDPAAPALTYRSRLAYLDLPVLYTWGPGNGGRGLYLLAGPQLSLALGQREWLRPTGEAPGGPAEISLLTHPRTLAPLAAGLVAGLGYQLPGGLGLEVRGSGDLTPVFRAGWGPACLLATGAGCRNLVVQLQLRYLFKARQPAGLGAPRPATATEAPTLPPPAWHPRWATPPAWPAPNPLPLPDSLAQNPGFRRLQRVLRVLEVLSWLHIDWSPGPALPAPGSPPRPNRPAARPLPRRLPERVAAP
jgi:hypothetical protein